MELPDIDSLIGILQDARRLGFLGPGPVEDHVRHSLGFAAAADHDGDKGPPEQPHDLVVDLGSGGGVPGLILAVAWPATSVVLVDASARRTAFLRAAAERLRLPPARVQVVRTRAEDLGREQRWRGSAPLVVARGFGPPAATAECAAPLMRVGARLVVSEPPQTGQKDGDGARWPPEGLELLGLATGSFLRLHGGSYRILHQDVSCPDRFPRRSGVPAKRPLF